MSRGQTREHALKWLSYQTNQGTLDGKYGWQDKWRVPYRGWVVIIFEQHKRGCCWIPWWESASDTRRKAIDAFNNCVDDYEKSRRKGEAHCVRCMVVPVKEGDDE